MDLEEERRADSNIRQRITSLLEVLVVSIKLGLTSFGGPVAHLGYFYEEYVQRRRWMGDKEYADLVALCQFLPGPASSQVSIGIGVLRAGVLGGIVSFLGFTLPSVIMLIVFAYIMISFEIGEVGWIHGLKIVAVVIVAHAIMGMAKNLTPDKQSKSIALIALITLSIWNTAYSQITIILLAAFIGYIWYRNTEEHNETTVRFTVSRGTAISCLSIFIGLLIAMPILRELTSSQMIAMFDAFYRAGALVFGGGHVVLPLLESEAVMNGWVSKEDFLAGYGATQAVPGPLFTFAAYIGTMMNGWFGGLIAIVAIFLPAFLLILAALPFWANLRRNTIINKALKGVNASVVGILAAAFYDPIVTSAILSTKDFALAATLFGMLVFWKIPIWMIVICGAVGGWTLSLY